MHKIDYKHLVGESPGRTSSPIRSDRLREEYDQLSCGKVRTYNLSNLIGEEESFCALIKKTKKIAKNSFPVLIYGETGTGKELFAQSIHFEGARKNKPFLAQNCAALPESLLESILFGAVKGSFTGAIDRPGLFEQASGGTLLLDEISAMPYALQSKLLRVLQEKYIRRVGDTKDIPVDVRIIATCNEPLEQLIAQGSFRKDLYYRLNAISLNLIPLRDRKKDIPLLARAFVKKHGSNPDIRFSDGAKEKLLDHDYYGNVRELENVIIASLTMMGEDNIIEKEHIQFSFSKPPEMYSSLYDLNGLTLTEKLEEVEQEIICRILSKNQGNISKSAEKMGIKRQTLQYKLKKIECRNPGTNCQSSWR